MAIQTPSFNEIQARIIQDIDAEFGQNIPILPRAIFRIYAFIYAGLYLTLWKYGQAIYKNISPLTCDDERLETQGERLNVLRKRAEKCKAEVSISVNSPVTIQPGTQFLSSQGVVYLVTTAKLLQTPTDTFEIESSQSGSAYTLSFGETVSIVSPLPQIASSGTVSDIITEGVDEENIDTYRSRVVTAYRRKPQGGAEVDYVIWGTEASFVNNVFPYAELNLNGVELYIEVNNQQNGIPTDDQLNTIKHDYIERDPSTGLATRRPIGAEVFMRSVIKRTIDIQFIGLTPDTPELRTSIENAVRTAIEQKKAFVFAVDIERNDTLTRSEISSIAQQITSLSGGSITDIILSENTISDIIFILGRGEMFLLGSVSWA